MAQRIGYVGKRGPNGRVQLTDGQGKIIGRGHVVNCRRIRPGEPGSWISSEKCSYRFQINGNWYHGRGYGEGMSISLRRMKRAPRGYE